VDVEKKRKNNGYMLGGITGKGFLPGKSGNPGGRPKKNRPLSDRYESIVEVPLPRKLLKVLELKKGATWGDAIAIAMARQGLKGNVHAAREMRVSIEGTETARIEVSGPDGGPIQQHDLNETLRLIAGFYNLDPEAVLGGTIDNGEGGAAETKEPAEPLSLPDEIRPGPEPTEDRREEP